MQYKENWEQTKANYTAFWNGEYFGRAAIGVTAPKGSECLVSPPPLPDNPSDKWIDFDYLAKLNHFCFNNTHYGGEALPVWTPGYPGWAQMSAYMKDGAHVKLDEATAWLSPVFKDTDVSALTERDMDYNPNNKWLQTALDMQKFAVEQCKGKAIPALMNNYGIADELSDMVDPAVLLMALLDCPEHVRKLETHLLDKVIEVYDQLFALANAKEDGNSNWFWMWAPGRFGVLQNDMSYMISKELFEECFFDLTVRLTEYFDYSIYHVDGEGSFKHVDLLCTIPKLHTIQILPGAGKPSPLHYLDVLKKVQKAGKNLHLTLEAEEVPKALDLLSAKGLFIQTTASSKEEADDLVSFVSKNSRIL